MGFKNIINCTCRNSPELRQHFNMEPIMVIDIIDKIKSKFPTLTDYHIDLLKRFTRRIENDEDVIKNTPRAVVAGILFLFTQVFKLTDITMDNIIDQLAISVSSITQYAKKFEYLVYDPTDY